MIIKGNFYSDRAVDQTQIDSFACDKQKGLCIMHDSMFSKTLTLGFT